MSNRVVHVPQLGRYELLAGDGGQLLGFVDYLPAGASVIVSHTEVDEGHEGQGLGAELVRGALDAIRASGKTVIPTCPFTAGSSTAIPTSTPTWWTRRCAASSSDHGGP